MEALEFSKSLNDITNSLKPYALRLTKDYEEANDLLQETMLKAYTNRDKFAEGTNLKAWLFTIMKNTFMTNYQKVVRKNTFIDSTDSNHFIDSSKVTTKNLAYSNIALKDFEEAIQGLEEIYKIPFVMYFRGFKYFEISKKLGIPIGTVKNRIHIARKELKVRLKVYARN